MEEIESPILEVLIGKINGIAAMIFRFESSINDYVITFIAGEEVARSAFLKNRIIHERLSNAFPKQHMYFRNFFDLAFKGEESESEGKIGRQVYHFKFFPIMRSEGDVIMGAAIWHNKTRIKKLEEKLDELHQVMQNVEHFVDHIAYKATAELEGLTQPGVNLPKARLIKEIRKSAEKLKSAIEQIQKLAEFFAK